MNDHFTVTIHDESGVRQFNVHKFVKRALFYAALFIFTLIFIAVGTILYLHESIEKTEKKRASIEKAYASLEENNRNLQANISMTNESLQEKKRELEELSDSLLEIEILMGIKPSQNKSIEERVVNTKLDSQHRALLLQLIPSGSPIEYKGITSKFGSRVHPILGKKEFHPGIDLKAKRGTPVYAPADGIVEWAAYHKKSGYGHLVIIDHIYGIKTYYGHLKKSVVKSGQFVKKGTLIAYTGNSGLSNGPHLHYEIRFVYKKLNPYWFIKWTQQNYDEIFEKEKKIPWQSLITATASLMQKQTQTQE
jgi:murein DD-endopeptidase MepM/ murein hydrolase activator NlpD